MNLYKPSTELESWQQMVVRMTKERDELIKENVELTKENLELKRRCCDLWKEVTEERARE